MKEEALFLRKFFLPFAHIDRALHEPLLWYKVCLRLVICDTHFSMQYAFLGERHIHCCLTTEPCHEVNASDKLQSCENNDCMINNKDNQFTAVLTGIRSVRWVHIPFSITCIIYDTIYTIQMLLFFLAFLIFLHDLYQLHYPLSILTLATLRAKLCIFH